MVTIRQLLLFLPLAVLVVSLVDARANVESFLKVRHALPLEKRTPLDGFLNDLEKVTSKIKLLKEGLPPLAAISNATVASACEAVDEQITDNSLVTYYGSLEFLGSVEHYMASSAQVPVCVFRPRSSKDLAAAMKIIHGRRIEFAVSAGKHTGNQGFSSTRGIQIDLRNLNRIELSSDKKSIDLGPGCIWDDVYHKLEGTGTTVLGGRASGIGVGGFITGGGGYSFLTSQHGLTSDSVLEAQVVLPNGEEVICSKTSHPDLFFAIKGGGNQFGIVTNFRLKTYPMGDKIWGGLRYYTVDRFDAGVKAVIEFFDNNKDPKAQVIPTFGSLAGIQLIGVIASYDGPKPPKDTFKVFDEAGPLLDLWGPITPRDLLQSSADNLTLGLRGASQAISVASYTREMVQFCADEIKELGGLVTHLLGEQGLRSGLYFGMTPELQMRNYGANTSADANAWSYDKSPLQFNFYYGWLSSADDAFYQGLVKQKAEKVRNIARRAGQPVDELPLYPNYAIGDTPVEKLFSTQNLARLRKIKQSVDPDDTMGLTGSFVF